MKIEAGKFYKTRDGKKAFVASFTPPNPFPDGGNTRYPFTGYVQGWDMETWTADGISFSDEENITDLVAEWREPASEERVVYLVRFSDGKVSCMMRKAKDGPPITKPIGSSRVTVTEGVFA